MNFQRHPFLFQSNENFNLSQICSSTKQRRIKLLANQSIIYIDNNYIKDQCSSSIIGISDYGLFSGLFINYIHLFFFIVFLMIENCIINEDGSALLSYINICQINEENVKLYEIFYHLLHMFYSSLKEKSSVIHSLNS